MAKNNDLQRLHVIDNFYSLTDAFGSAFFSPSSLGRFQITFGEVNKKAAIGRVKVSASLYMTGYGTYRFVFYGFFNYLSNDCDFRSVEIEREFKETILLSINDHKISRSWLLEEEGEGDVHAVQDGACLAEAVADVDSDSYTKYCAVNSSFL